MLSVKNEGTSTASENSIHNSELNLNNNNNWEDYKIINKLKGLYILFYLFCGFNKNPSNYWMMALTYSSSN